MLHELVKLRGLHAEFVIFSPTGTGHSRLQSLESSLHGGQMSSEQLQVNLADHENSKSVYTFKLGM